MPLQAEVLEASAFVYFSERAIARMQTIAYSSYTRRMRGGVGGAAVETLTSDRCAWPVNRVNAHVPPFFGEH